MENNNNSINSLKDALNPLREHALTLIFSAIVAKRLEKVLLRSLYFGNNTEGKAGFIIGASLRKDDGYSQWHVVYMDSQINYTYTPFEEMAIEDMLILLEEIPGGEAHEVGFEEKTDEELAEENDGI